MAIIEHRVERADGARVAAQVGGARAGVPLLLLQGQACSHRWWDGLRERWEAERPTITLDYRGTGATTDPGGDLSTRLLAEDAVAVLDALGHPRADVYGTSMGGRVAQVLAAEHPGRVRTLALACTSPGGPHAAERGAEVRRALADPDQQARTATMADLFFTPAWTGDRVTSPLFGDPTMSPADRQRHLRTSARHDAWDLLPRITAPTLVLHGVEDRMTPAGNAALIAGRVPDARVHLHPQGRHGLFAEFADDLEPLLRELWEGRAQG